MSTLCLIDGHAQLYRAYHAMSQQGFTAPDGRTTGAAYGFTRMLNDLENTLKPDYLAVVFDSHGPTFRHETYPQYKANRSETPEDIITQTPMVMTILSLRNIPVLKIQGWEADDIIATLAMQSKNEDIEVLIVSGDKDFGQILSEGIRLCRPDKMGKYNLIDAAAFENEWGVKPALIPDLFGLMGDSVDNIPGVPGFGAKIGAELIRCYKSLEKLLACAHEIKGKRGEVLRANKTNALLSKQLATIRTDAPVVFNQEEFACKAPKIAELRAYYKELGMFSFIRDLNLRYPSTNADDPIPFSEGQEEDNGESEADNDPMDF